MTKYELPTQEKKWIQGNKGDVIGNLWSTFNMDFDSSKGRVRVARPTRVNTDNTDDADLGLPWAFARTSASGTDQWWAGCGAVLFKTAGTSPTGAFTQDALGSSPTGLGVSISDMIKFEGALIVSESTDLNRLSGGVWDANWWITTLAQPVLTANIAHPLCVTKKTNVLLVGDGNKIHLIDKNSNVNNSRLVFPSEFECVWIRSNFSGSWIGMRNKVNDKEAEAFFWDEQAENYNQSYKLKSNMTFACEIKDGIPFTVNGAGQLLAYDGSGFTEKAVFPNFQQVSGILDDSSSPRMSVHRNGMAIIEEKLHINICSLIDNDPVLSMENFPSGVWTYDSDEGLRHKHSISMYDGTENDYGSFISTRAGALVPTGTRHLFLTGNIIPIINTTNLTCINYVDGTGASFNSVMNKRGHFVTSLFESSNFEDIFQDLLLTFKRFGNSGDRIIVKYQTIKNPSYPIKSPGTWTSTTTFTATTPDFGSLATIAIGDEVMIIRGKGSGATAKISSVSELAGTYTITLAEAIVNVGTGTMRFIVQDWTECAIVSTQSIERQSFDLDVVGTFLQLKVEIRNVTAEATAASTTTPELEKLVVQSIKENDI